MSSAVKTAIAAGASQAAQTDRSSLNMTEGDLKMPGSELTLLQRVAICFPAGVIGALAVVLFSHVLFRLGLSATLGVEAPVSLKAPDIYRPLFLGRAVGYPVWAFDKNRLEAAVPLRASLLPGAGAGVVYHLSLIHI